MTLAIIISVLVITIFVVTRGKAPKRPTKRGGDLEVPKDDGEYKPDDKEKGLEEYENPPKQREPQIK